MKKLIIAGTHLEAVEWRRRDCDRRWAAGDTSTLLTDYIIVDAFEYLIGTKEPHGVFVGTWITRKDLLPIFMQLLYATDISLEGQKIVNEQFELWKNAERS